MNTRTQPRPRQEPDRIHTAPVLGAIGAAVVLGGLGVLWAGLQLRGKDALYRPAGEQSARGEVATGPASIGGISQTLIGVDSSTAVQKRQSLQTLETFQWLDRQQGIARLPIDSAMQIIIRRNRQ